MVFHAQVVLAGSSAVSGKHRSHERRGSALGNTLRTSHQCCVHVGRARQGTLPSTHTCVSISHPFLPPLLVESCRRANRHHKCCFPGCTLRHKEKAAKSERHKQTKQRGGAKTQKRPQRAGFCWSANGSGSCGGGGGRRHRRRTYWLWLAFQLLLTLMLMHGRVEICSPAHLLTCSTRWLLLWASMACGAEPAGMREAGPFCLSSSDDVSFGIGVRSTSLSPTFAGLGSGRSGSDLPALPPCCILAFLHAAREGWESGKRFFASALCGPFRCCCLLLVYTKARFFEEICTAPALWLPAHTHGHACTQTHGEKARRETEREREHSG